MPVAWRVTTRVGTRVRDFVAVASTSRQAMAAVRKVWGFTNATITISNAGLEGINWLGLKDGQVMKISQPQARRVA